MRSLVNFVPSVALPFMLGACGASSTPATAPGGDVVADVWADNWFALYQGDTLVKEDSVPITTERSFNSESFTFTPTWPLQLSFIVKDFKQDDSGLEYIGQPNQQMGDGGFIFQIRDDKGATIAVSDASTRCLVIHEAPLDKSCVTSSDPSATCGSRIEKEPEGWKLAGFDDSAWPAATEYSAGDVRPKDGYDQITWDSSARLIWAGDLQTDNTLLCRLQVPKP